MHSTFSCQKQPGFLFLMDFAPQVNIKCGVSVKKLWILVQSCGSYLQISTHNLWSILLKYPTIKPRLNLLSRSSNMWRLLFAGSSQLSDLTISLNAVICELTGHEIQNLTVANLVLWLNCVLTFTDHDKMR